MAEMTDLGRPRFNEEVALRVFILVNILYEKVLAGILGSQSRISILKILLYFGIGESLPVSHKLVPLCLLPRVSFIAEFWVNNPGLVDLREDVLVDVLKAKQLRDARIYLRDYIVKGVFIISKENLNMGIAHHEFSEGRDSEVIKGLLLISDEG